MRIGRTYIALTFREFVEAPHDELCKRLGIYHPTDQPDPEWVEREQNARAEGELADAQASI